MQGLDHEQRHERVSHAHCGPAVGEVGRECRPIGPLFERSGKARTAGLAGVRLSGLGFAGERCASQADHRDGARDDEGAGVHEERGADRPRGERSADGRTGDATEQEATLEQSDRAATLLGGDHAQEQSHRTDREHRRADAPDAAQHEELQVAVREAGERAADRDDADAAREDDAFTDGVDEAADTEGGREAHERKGGENGPDLRLTDAEVMGEQWDDRRDDAEADRHAERHGREYGDLVRQVAEHLHTQPVHCRHATPLTAASPGGRDERAGSRSRRSRRACRRTARRRVRRCAWLACRRNRQGPCRPRA